MMGWLRGRAKGPLFPVLVGTLSSIVFFAGGLYQEQIRNAFPFYWGLGPVAIAPLGFWLSMIGVAVLLAARGLADEEARVALVRKTEEISRTAAELQTLIQTLPPLAWRTVYGDIVADIFQTLEQVRPRSNAHGLTREQLEHTIRLLLRSVASLAKRYDEGREGLPANAVFGANVMLYQARQDTADSFPGIHRDAIRFLSNGMSLDALDGLLVLRPELSYSTDSDGQDTAFPVLALPIPASRKSPRDRWRVLPGAPMAYVCQEVDGYSDSHTLAEWFNQRGDFPASTQDEVVSYFRDGVGTVSRSFISRPLTCGGRELGVVNLHSDHPDIFGVQRFRPGDRLATEAAGVRRETFFSMITPLWEELGTAVVAYLDFGH